MKPNTARVGSLAFAGVLALLGATAHAGNINTSGIACRNYNAAEALDIDYLTFGVRNVNPSPRIVICPVVRSPLASGITGGFYVNGHNNTGISTTCTLTSTNYNGAILGSQSFTTSLTDYDQLVTFPAAQVTTYAYISLMCTLAGNGNAVLRGVTAVQP